MRQLELKFNKIIGMNQDMGISKARYSEDGQLAFTIHNMRCTFNGRGNLMTWTNEQGTKLSLIQDADYNDGVPINPFSGNVLQYAVIGDYLILFTDEGKSFKLFDPVSGDAVYNTYNSAIYRLTLDEDTFTSTCIITGDFNFNTDYTKWETLTSYENEHILKVYWLDGINQPRQINIVNTYTDDDATKIDFVPLDENNISVDITKVYQTSTLVAGTVQYIINYYNLYGQLTNLAYLSPVLYISYNTTGANVDVVPNCAFKLKIKNINTKYDYIRVYSISRTAKGESYSDSLIDIVIDLPITDVSYDEDNTPYIEITDDGTEHTTISYDLLKYINNNTFVPLTFTQKDGTLFFSNYKYDSIADNDIKEILKQVNPSDYIRFVNTTLLTESTDLLYPYTNQLKYSSNDILGFKGNESYLFGIVFQDYRDKWSSVIPLGNKEIKNTLYPSVTITDDDLYLINLVKAEFYNTEKLKGLLGNYLDNIKAFKIVIVTKNETLRNVICQGIMCPTVFSAEERYKKTPPFALASWFFRPICKYAPDEYNNSLLGTDSSKLSNDIMQTLGSVLEFRHNKCLPNSSYANCEIQCIGIHEELSITNNFGLKSSVDKHRFGIDCSIVTMHSPDIEFNSSLLNILDRNTGYRFRTVGASYVLSTNSSVYIDSNGNSFLSANAKNIYSVDVNYNRLGLFTYNSSHKTRAFASLNTYFGIDIRLKQYSADGEGELLDDNVELIGCVFPWQRDASITPLVLPNASSDSDAYSYQLPIKTKIYANSKICVETKYDSAFQWKPTDNGNTNISSIGISTPNNTLVKIKDTLSPWSEEQLTYYGNVDTMLTNNQYENYVYWGYTGTKTKSIGGKNYYNPTYKINRSFETRVLGDNENYYSNPVRMKYKSSTHAVFSLSYTTDNNGKLQLLILPTSNTIYNSYGAPYWNFDIGDITDGNIILVNLLNIPLFRYSDLNSSSIKSITLDDCISTSANYESTLSNFIPISKSLITLGTLGKIWTEKVNETISGESKEVTYWYYTGLYAYIITTDIIKESNLNKKYPYIIVLIDEVLRTVDNVTTTTSNSRLIVPSNYSIMLIASIGGSPSKGLSSITADSTLYFYNNGMASTVNYVTNPTSDKINNSNYIRSNNTLLFNDNRALFLIGELYNDSAVLGTTEYELSKYVWLDSSESVSIDNTNTVTLFGDTYFQRYDCLKTMPYAVTDTNQIIEIGSFMLETYINLDGRYDRNRGLVDNTTVTLLNFNLINTAYTLNNTSFLSKYILNKRIENIDRKCTCQWSLKKTFGADIDRWTTITGLSTIDLNGTLGPIHRIFNYNNKLLTFQDNGVAIIKYNEQTALSTNSGESIEIANTEKVTGVEYISTNIGTTNKKSIISTNDSLFFLDNNSKSIYRTTELGLKSISDNTFSQWLRFQDFDKEITFYDENTKEVHFVFLDKVDYYDLVFSLISNTFTSFYDYNLRFAFNYKNRFISINDDDQTVMWFMHEGVYNTFFDNVMPYSISAIAGGNCIDDKIFDTVEFRADMFEDNKNLMDETFDTLTVWNEYQMGIANLTTVGSIDLYNDITKKHYTNSSIHLPSNLKRKFRIWRANIPRALELNSSLSIMPGFTSKDQSDYSDNLPYTTVDNIEYDEQYSRDRIRNPWACVQLYKKSPEDKKLVLHDFTVKYFQ